MAACPNHSVVVKSLPLMLFLMSLFTPVSTSAPPVCEGLEESTIEIPIHEKRGGAYEYKKSGVTYTGGLGELYVGRVASDRGNVLSALRFAEVHVPKNASVSKAHVYLVDAHVGRVCCQGEDLTVLLRMEHAAHSTPLPGQRVDGWLLSSLPTTASMPWRPPVTETYNVSVTPDLRDMFQTIINMEEWVSGNAMTLLMNGEGAVAETDERVYFGSGGSRGQQAMLKISFCEPQQFDDAKPQGEVKPSTTTCPPAPACRLCPLNATVDNVVLTDGTVPASAEEPPQSAMVGGLSVGLVAGLCCLVGMITSTVRQRRSLRRSTEGCQLFTVTPETD